jgi:DNA-binding GntR family transcriptional regulator
MTERARTAEAIYRPALHHEVADRLRELILKGELAPGERLNERALSERFGISRTPLREAIKVLSTGGLVELLPNRGAIVTRLTRTQAEDMFQLMGVLEGLAGELACARASDTDISEIRALHYQMLVHHTRGELAEYFSLNQRIHRKIVDCARNGELASVYQSLAERIRSARYLANFSKERWDHAVKEHGEILAALEKRNGEQLKTILKAHLANKFDVVREFLSESEEAAAEGKAS